MHDRLLPAIGKGYGDGVEKGFLFYCYVDHLCYNCL